MSTKVTRKSPRAGLDLADSHALSLTQAMGAWLDRTSVWLLEKLERDGFAKLTGSQLAFLGALDCGPNHASNLARGLGISRQAVYKTVRELERAGWLTTEPDEKIGNQRVITFTIEGERMMAAARQHFSNLDKALLNEFGEASLKQMGQFLDFNPLSNDQGS